MTEVFDEGGIPKVGPESTITVAFRADGAWLIGEAEARRVVFFNRSGVLLAVQRYSLDTFMQETGKAGTHFIIAPRELFVMMLERYGEFGGRLMRVNVLNAEVVTDVEIEGREPHQEGYDPSPGGPDEGPQSAPDWPVDPGTPRLDSGDVDPWGSTEEKP